LIDVHCDSGFSTARYQFDNFVYATTNTATRTSSRKLNSLKSKPATQNSHHNKPTPSPKNRQIRMRHFRAHLIGIPTALHIRGHQPPTIHKPHDPALNGKMPQLNRVHKRHVPPPFPQRQPRYPRPLVGNKQPAACDRPTRPRVQSQSQAASLALSMWSYSIIGLPW
jgi:hypothetical protein